MSRVENGGNPALTCGNVIGADRPSMAFGDPPETSLRHVRCAEEHFSQPIGGACAGSTGAGTSEGSLTGRGQTVLYLMRWCASVLAHVTGVNPGPASQSIWMTAPSFRALPAHSSGGTEPARGSAWLCADPDCLGS